MNISRLSALTAVSAILVGCANGSAESRANLQAESTAKEQFSIKTDKPCISGVYPHLAMWNSEGECGTGAVVPWAGKLWAVTYGPHCVFKSDDKLYEIDPNLNVKVREESLGGTHANRMIHKESNQLIIGCYFIDSKGNVRAIPREKMPGRFTGNARSLSDPENKVYFASMEEGLYEVDVNTLDVIEIIRDGNLKPYPKKTDSNGAEIKQPVISKLHGYHGKGLCSGFGKVFYANNGVHHKDIDKDPTLPSGALGEWKPGDADWSPIRINQFTEITCRDGIYGNLNPDKNTLWTIGFDAKSLILMVCQDGKWSSMRLPKASHSYDGSHGWNTEWPRIRDIGSKDYLMTMHGAFWNFPPDFSAENAKGIRMRSNYLKVVGDFCKWQNKIVLACDDSANKEFLNKRDLKSEKVSPAQSNSNFVFMDESEIETRGPAIGRGSVFLREDVKAQTASDAMLTGGFENCILALSHSSTYPVSVEIQTGDGDGKFSTHKTVKLGANSSKFIDISDVGAEWVRIMPTQDAKNFTAHFNMSNPDKRSKTSDNIFEGIGTDKNKSATAALLWGMGGETRKLAVIPYATDSAADTKQIGAYTLNWKLDLAPEKMPKNEKRTKETAYEPKSISYDGNSILIIEDGKRYRLPVNKPFPLKNAFGNPRVAREVATERDLLNCGGTFYELPAKNAQGIAKVRPIASHNLDIFDFCSYRGLMLISGMKADAVNMKSPHVIVSQDKKFALWAGIIDDLWKLGKPVGGGNVWFRKDVSKSEMSDPFLLTAYDKKSVEIKSDSDLSIALEIDIDGTGLWLPYQTLKIKGGETFEKTFDNTFRGYWVRAKALNDASNVSVKFIYE